MQIISNFLPSSPFGLFLSVWVAMKTFKMSTLTSKAWRDMQSLLLTVEEFYLKIKKFIYLFLFHVVLQNIISIKPPSFSIYSHVGQEPNTLVHSSSEFLVSAQMVDFGTQQKSHLWKESDAMIS